MKLLVNFDSGLDTNTGEPHSPLRTLQAAVLKLTSGSSVLDNVIEFEGTARPSGASAAAYNNFIVAATATYRPTVIDTWTTTSGFVNPPFTLKVKQGERARITGRTPFSALAAPPVWAETATGVYSCTIPTGLKVVAITYKYEDEETWVPLVDGRMAPTGFLDMKADVATVSANNYSAVYDSVTGDVRIRDSRLIAAPDNADVCLVFGHPTSTNTDNQYAGIEIRSDDPAINPRVLLDLTNCIIDCINPMATGIPAGSVIPYGVSLVNCKGTIVKNGLAYSCGYHPFGAVGKVDIDNEFINCDSLGAGPASTNFVFYSGAADADDVTGARATDCYAGVYPPIRVDGMAFATNTVVTSSPSGGLTGFYCHTDVTNSWIVDVLCTRCVASTYQIPGSNIHANFAAFGTGECHVDHRPVAGSSEELDWENYAVRCENCVSWGLPVRLGHSASNVSCLVMHNFAQWLGMHTNTITNTLNVPVNGWTGTSSGASTLAFDGFWCKPDYNFKDNGATDRIPLVLGATTQDQSKNLILKNMTLVSGTDAARSMIFFHLGFSAVAANYNTVSLINSIVTKTQANNVDVFEVHASETVATLQNTLIPRCTGNIFYLPGGTVKLTTATAADTSAEFRTGFGSANVVDVDPGLSSPNTSPMLPLTSFAANMRGPVKGSVAINGPGGGHPGCWNPNFTIPCKSGTVPTFEDVAEYLTGRKRYR